MSAKQQNCARRSKDVLLDGPRTSQAQATDAHWAVRAAIDAVVAHAYGLTRDQYAHVFSTFSHSSYKDALRQCLAAFDELQQIALEPFTKKYDPYWNIHRSEERRVG